MATEADKLADALLGKVDKDGDILWSGSPRSMHKPPPTDSPPPNAQLSGGIRDETDQGGSDA